MVTSMLEDENGTLWVGTSGGGLNRFNGSAFSAITTKEGLYDDKIFQIIIIIHPDHFTVQTWW